ncbi:hypothetical protein SteCoe_30771 [Stentor coeruleus]|uniref:VHS domain-containing protein n=1 Tax=Stentor coeruleus TaxID=5963 RepID=A0A1R2B2T3_9CILI|nr:hypothetical protein SteCoe_30771 [Stentor coeruleus]
MNSEEEKILNQIIASQNSDNLIPIFLSKFSNCEEQLMKILLKQLTFELVSVNAHYITKLQSVRMLKHLISSKIPIVISYIDKHIVPKFPAIILGEEDCQGFSLWLNFLKIKDKNAFKFMILALQCIENWGKIFKYNSKSTYTHFYQILNIIKENNIEMPPTFFLKPFEKTDKKIVKKDFYKVKNLLKEFVNNIYQGNKEKALLLKKVVNSYENYFKESAEKYDKSIECDVISIYLEVKQAKSIMQTWKNNKYTEVPQKNIISLNHIDDPLPKEQPNNENSREDLSLLNHSFDPDFSDSKQQENSYKQKKINPIQKDSELKTQVEELENLVNMYKQDLIKSQANNHALERENNELKIKNKALVVTNTDLERNILDKKANFDELFNENQKISKENTKLQKRLEKTLSSNEFFKKSIEELHDLVDTLSHESFQNKIYVDSIKNTNKLLLSTNQSLRNEIEDLKNHEKDLKKRLKSIKKSAKTAGKEKTQS